jgi:hypothetical protein
MFGNCDASSWDVFDKTKAHFPPNYIFISFVYLTVDDISVSRGKLESKRPSGLQKYPKCPQNSFKTHFLWEIVKTPATTSHCHFGEFLSIFIVILAFEILYGEHLLKKTAIFVVKKINCWSAASHINKYTCLVFN